MKKQIITTITIAILAVASLAVFMGASGSAPQYLVVQDVQIGALQSLLNLESKAGWKLHSFESMHAVAIFEKN